MPAVNRSSRRQQQQAPTSVRRSTRANRLSFLRSPFVLGALGAIGGVLLIGYLISQASGTNDGHSSGDHAAADDSPDLPGVFVASQGGRHLEYSFTRSHSPVPYCEGIEWAGMDVSSATATPQTSDPTPTAIVTGTPPVPDDCYMSNPPSSGPMLGGQRGAEVGDGVLMDFPPAPDVYPRDVDIPREAIVHSLEHAGVFIGYNCATDNQPCWDVVSDLEDLANKRIENNDNRVTMGYFSDLPEGQIGLSAWTRVERFSFEEYDRKEAERFISTHSCRYDEEGVC